MRPPRACVSVRRTIWAVLCTLGVLSVVVSASAAPKQISIVYCSDCVPFHFTDKDGNVTTVDKTWQFVKDDNGQLRIVVHHSSLEYTPDHSVSDM